MITPLKKEKCFQESIDDIYLYLPHSRCSTFLSILGFTKIQCAKARPVVTAVAAPITAATPMRYGAFVQARSSGRFLSTQKG